MKISTDDNFMRIFRLPNTFPRGFCFGEGMSVNFQMVDWFNPVPPDEISDFDEEKIVEDIIEFIKNKNYYDAAYKFLAITNYGDSFLI